MSLWATRKATAIQNEKASQRLDCFLSVCYLFPNCLDPKDMDLMAQRERELTKIYSYSGRGFFCLYGLTMAGLCLRRGTTPYFKDVIKHSILAVGGTFVVAKLSHT
jgi:hypothetical protein